MIGLAPLHLVLSVCLLAVDSALAAVPQDTEEQSAKKQSQVPPAPVPRPKLERMPPKFRKKVAGPLMASDDKPVEPGRIPEDTKDNARNLWEAVKAATVTEGAGTTPPRVESFQFRFDATGRHETGRNDFKLDVLFLDRPQGDFMKATMVKSNRIQLRGPQGDFLIDKSGKATSLTGRENRISRQDMNQWIAIANHLLTLVNASDVRIVKLAQVAAPVKSFPPGMKTKPDDLAWLELTSPDLHLYPVEDDKAEPVVRATLGVGGDGRVLVTLLEDTNRANASYARLVEHERWHDFDGRLLPLDLLVYTVDPVSRKFYPKPKFELTLYKDGRLNPQLNMSDFQPK